jgi:hypothetical protein
VLGCQYRNKSLDSVKGRDFCLNLQTVYIFEYTRSLLLKHTYFLKHLFSMWYFKSASCIIYIITGILQVLLDFLTQFVPENVYESRTVDMML